MNTLDKIPLYGFNNLTKSLNFSLYRVHFIPNQDEEHYYHSFINQEYSSENLTKILSKICHAIGGNILNVAKQDYSPQGASVTLMISEEAKPESLVAHIDKSHICIHTYPEEKTQTGIAIFRADIELSTCGVISPLKVLDYVINIFSADVIDIDYRVRGMTRDKHGKKYFCDHNIKNISDHLEEKTRQTFQIKEDALATKNLFHSKLAKHNIDISEHVFFNEKTLINDIEIQQKEKIKTLIKNEINSLFDAY